MTLTPMLARAVATVGRSVLSTSAAPLSTSALLRQTPEPSSPPLASRSAEKCLNAVTLLGRVGVDPQLRGSDRHPVVVFSLATNIRYKSNNASDVDGGGAEENEWQVKTDWHNIAVFKPKLLESVQQTVSKGQRVLVQGRLMYGQVEDRAGVTRHTTTIVADDVIRFASVASSE